MAAEVDSFDNMLSKIDEYEDLEIQEAIIASLQNKKNIERQQLMFEQDLEYVIALSMQDKNESEKKESVVIMKTIKEDPYENIKQLTKEELRKKRLNFFKK